MASNRFPHLLSEGRIGTMATRNRIVVTAMGVGFAEEDGEAGERLIAYHEEQARGGAGLIVTGVTGVGWPGGAVTRNQTAISEDRFIPGLTRLTRRIQAQGARIAAQLHHGGLVAAYSAFAFGEPLWAPALPPPPKGDIGRYFLEEEMAGMEGLPVPQVRVLDKADIDRAVEMFRQAARRAVDAGFDGIEIHGGHGYLLSSFTSPASNDRKDEYGGSLENRARLSLDVLRAVRAETGPDFPVWMKIDAREVGKPEGITLDLACDYARLVEVAGADALTVTAYHDTGLGKLHSDSHTPHAEGRNLDAVSRIRRAVSIPVIGSGRIEPEAGDRAIGAGKADFIAMGRKLLADPHLPARLSRGEIEAVRPCIYCYTCISAIYTGDVGRCAVNPELGFEAELPAAPAPRRERVAVVGGGPGGMEAARRLRLLGHDVVLFEKGGRLGGTLRFAALAYAANERLLDWLEREVKGADIDLRLATEATPALLRREAIGTVFVATGAVRDLPPVPGADGDHVLSGDDLRALVLGEGGPDLARKTSLAARIASRFGAATGASANLTLLRKATHAWMPLAGEVAIIGGELVGIELAEFLVERGRKVHVIDEAPRLGRGLTFVRRMRILAELAEHGVSLHAGVGDVVIERDHVRFIDAEGRGCKVRAGNVIVAQGARGDTRLADALAGEGLDVHAFGDATGVSYIEGAMRGAAEAVGAFAAGRTRTSPVRVMRRQGEDLIQSS